MASSAMFAGLVVDEEGNAAEVAYVGENACYVVTMMDFKRHIDASWSICRCCDLCVDRSEDQRDLAVDTMLDMMGKDDIFTKAAVESSIDNIEDAVGQALPEDARQFLGMLGFRIIIDFQGTVVDMELPAGEIDEE